MFSLLALTLLASLVFAAPAALPDTSVDVVRNAFSNAKIVPDVVPSFNPRIPLQVKFPQDDGTFISVQAGVQLTVNQTKNRPVFDVLPNIFSAEQITHSAFTVVMVDPDAPTPQNRNLSQIRHLVAPDFTSATPDADGHFQLTNQTAALADYFPPGPPPGSPAHRYTILLYLQDKPGAVKAPADFKPNDATVLDNLVLFNATKFADDVGGLTLIAGTFFLVAPDDVPIEGSGANAGNSTNGVPPSECSDPRAGCIRVPLLKVFICPPVHK
ncbi:PEBP-like protein [Exidia glandulosa HHB12029]|uniref:PEBP-like protein n=1 Tax=Exidia glandulosa HHB12029 TaxID=1314781 RepID=A0A165PTT8_EXIGL|nr:PEBP-like protein [Exidia glandulosa HHB12029]